MLEIPSPSPYVRSFQHGNHSPGRLLAPKSWYTCKFSVARSTKRNFDRHYDGRILNIVMQCLRSARSYTTRESSYAHTEFRERLYVLITGVPGTSRWFKGCEQKCQWKFKEIIRSLPEIIRSEKKFLNKNYFVTKCFKLIFEKSRFFSSAVF